MKQQQRQAGNPQKNSLLQSLRLLLIDVMVLLFYSHDGGSYSDYFSDTYHYAYDWLSGSLDNCPFRDNMMELIKHKYVHHKFSYLGTTRL